MVLEQSNLLPDKPSFSNVVSPYCLTCVFAYKFVLVFVQYKETLQIYIYNYALEGQ